MDARFRARRGRMMALALGTVVLCACREDIDRPPNGATYANDGDARGGEARTDGKAADARLQASQLEGGALDVAARDGSVDAPGDGPARDTAIDLAPDQGRDLAADQGRDLAPDGAVSTCGMSGQACCPGNACRNGGCCLEGRCVAAGTPCRQDATCFGGSCGGCGGQTIGVPQSCCEARVCTASRTACQGGGSGTCQPCGKGGEACCQDGFCDSGFTCDRNQLAPGGLCVSCGKRGQPCCSGESCESGTLCRQGTCH